MKVIAHQHIRVQRAAKALRELRQMIQEELVVVVSEKARLTIVAALDDARRKTSDLGALAPRHVSASMSSPPAP